MKVGIIGLGLIGGSIALKLRDIFAHIKIYGFDLNDNSLEYSIINNIVDNTLSLDNLEGLDYIFIAIPVDSLKKELPDILDKVSDDTLVIDLGSTKYEICKHVLNHKRRKNFLAAHPIAGTEFSGPAASKKELFDDKVIIICDVEKTQLELLDKAMILFSKMNMKIKKMSSINHDKHIAYVSHLSHISSFMLGKTVMDKEKDEDTIYDMAGSGFESTVRLAKSSPETWSSIFLENKKNIIESLNEYISNINNFKDLIENDEKEKLLNEMNKINGIKEILKGIK
ncbi:MAG: prephenate dehydrogenase [Bacteroidota bacterium]